MTVNTLPQNEKQVGTCPKCKKRLVLKGEDVFCEDWTGCGYMINVYAYSDELEAKICVLTK